MRSEKAAGSMSSSPGSTPSFMSRGTASMVSVTISFMWVALRWAPMTSFLKPGCARASPARASANIWASSLVSRYSRAAGKMPPRIAWDI